MEEKVLVNKRADAVFLFESLFRQTLKANLPSQVVLMSRFESTKVKSEAIRENLYSGQNDTHICTLIVIYHSLQIGFCPLSAQWLNYCCRHCHSTSVGTWRKCFITGKLRFILPNMAPLGKGREGPFKQGTVGAHLVFVLETLETEQQDIGTSSLSWYSC